jgi:hypothetical protein
MMDDGWWMMHDGGLSAGGSFHLLGIWESSLPLVSFTTLLDPTQSMYAITD